MPDNTPFDDDAIRRARAELAGVESVRPQILERVAATAIKRSRVVGVSVLVCLALVSIAAIWFSTHRVDRLNSEPPMLAEGPQLHVGNAEITEHVAAMLNPSAVLVVWSSRGTRESVGPGDSSVERAGQYRHQLLHRATLPDGRTLNCTLFIADDGVRPALEPPFITARADVQTAMCLTASPKLTSAADLPGSLRSAGIGEQHTIENIVGQIHEQLR